MTDSANSIWPRIDWRSALLLAVLAGSFLAGRITIQHRAAVLQAEMDHITLQLRIIAAQEKGPEPPPEYETSDFEQAAAASPHITASLTDAPLTDAPQ
ncbi:MAG: hypothetical protein KY475_00650 [Planctomycetes bacterium]|nr:hypothetical protein [Planctomycetota bacterium]